MHLLSSLRVGVRLGILENISTELLNDLFLHTQPAHLQKLQGEPLESSERNLARASYLRQRLNGGS